MADYIDRDPEETREWLEALEAVVEEEGSEKAHFLIQKLIDRARKQGIKVPYRATTPYINTLTPEESEMMPGNTLIARDVAAYIRWNAMAMVVKANRKPGGLGGHIASFASSAALYEVGFDYFFKGPNAPDREDLIFFQGHSSPGMYARAFVEGRLSEEQLNHFREETEGKGLSSYPHPWLMPDFWQFPTVSMGLGPMQAIYQARFMKYMQARGHASVGDRKVWAFLGDGETDEPESQGAISLAAREKLDNLIFVINCNLQRLDGPVRGNGKIIQELEGNFRGAGWNVIKVIWGTEWDELLNKDKSGLLVKRMNECLDGEYQTMKARGGAYIREKFFGKYPELLELVKEKTDEQIFKLSRGGHDPRKIYAAYASAVKHKDQPTVILAKTVKGFGMGASGEAANTTHSQKKMDLDSLMVFRDRHNIPLKDEELYDVPFIRPAEDSKVMKFIRQQREGLGGYLPARNTKSTALPVPALDSFSSILKGSADKEMSTTMAFVRLLSTLAKNKEIGRNVVPIVPDEARTFGMEGMFRQLGIYSPYGQLYEPQDSQSVMWYKEDKKGQILEEGINEAGAFSSWLAAGTAYSHYGINMVPFYIFYSMFGFQRIGDLAWLAGDIRAKGFLIGATSGRTTLNGEGLQHQDGHGHVMAGTIPSCISYDPSYSYELAVIIQDGMRRMYDDNESIFYYISVTNENYVQPELPVGSEEGIRKGMYLFRKAAGKGKNVQLMGSGSIFQEVLAAAELLKSDWKVDSDIWSLPGINQLHREGVDCERWNLNHPEKKAKIPYVTQIMEGHEGPAVISTDYIRAYPEQIRRLIPNSLTVLGTDGYGRSDTREQLRRFFEMDRYYITLNALKGLVEQGDMDASVLGEALKKYNLDSEKSNPMTV
ncbi:MULTISPECIES: pyruvate dehydrogenase (acetyl-transferring), homodimeric type [unclassified Oceanispirochaeta]|uniref:pyruvate dehydrogenase (acetyl-transferring), homodimeric type n=1 Tax=unclassified Oceanispirochaeta TaxID=2635722 RepID=UPI000E09B0BC|nr:MULTISPECIES: pyruvate dehydrogenase (acetyl-transferring), homodimeric type [unclassified Oceanispirochaeta]MBF9014121.1 pyruvate dehydrogenase (acetyl-transferring), homodimeric type [Oceanispirochaeta sp. M2]NPD70612.1 pyruvate dehydrogenase (acetyl-transferring), homodimeric type [Oceanispirochaeta sp. M1]RDG34377.1 pyruvate dehydrogenase (acetyl-transferring), homodimeric type [Oceanispirochaeta sp. M1]